MIKCPVCNKGTLEKKVIHYNIYDIEIGKFPGKKCSECGEEWFDEETSLKIEKKMGLFGLSKNSKLSYSGNLLIVRIPATIAKFMKLEREIDFNPPRREK